MNPDSAQISFFTPTHASADRRLDAIGATITVALHILLIAIMLRPALDNSSRARSSGQQAAMQVSFVTEQQTPAPVTPQQAVEIPQEMRPIDTAPTPVPVSKPVAKPAESKAASKSAVSSNSAAAPSDQPANDSKELEDVIGRIRDNWLEPPGVTPSFRCRLRIDYAIGGKIMAVNSIKGCGALALDDSVKRAIWKTQSLTLRSARREAGSIEIDFTP